MGPYSTSLISYQADHFCPKEEDIITCLKNIINQCPRAFILVDSIHECVDSLKLGLLVILRDLSISGANIFVTSRSVPDVQYFRSGSFESLQLAEIRIAADHEDIRKYVESAIIANHNLARLVNKFSDLQEKIQSGIVAGADHLYVVSPSYAFFLLSTLFRFVLAVLHVKEIVQQMTASSIERALKSLPTDIDAAYGTTMSMISNLGHKQRILAYHTLSLIALAFRPLQANELLHALFIDDNAKELPSGRDVCDINNILSTCMGMVVMKGDEEVLSFFREFHFEAEMAFI
jgi:hypothetical protein